MNSSLIGKIEKAKRYAQEPDRISFTQFTVTFRGDNGSHILSYHEGQWHCSCHFFARRGLCSHTMTLERLLGEMLPKEARPTGVA